MKLLSAVLPILLLFTVCVTSIEIIRQPNFNAQCTRNLKEIPLPPAVQTHEIFHISGTNMFLISQQSSGVLLKVLMNNEKTQIVDLSAFQIGGNNSGLHGFASSTKNQGKVWVTLEFLNKIILIDPRVNSVKSSPKIIKTVDIPAPGNGPHYVGEYGNELWISLKDSDHVLRINHANPSNYTLYQGVPNPIFVAKHPINQHYYASQDSSSQIIKINPSTGIVTQLPIDLSKGSTPVGLISGPNGIWFVLLGNSTSGTGTFGFIDSNDNIKYFTLTSPLGQNAALLHLNFDYRKKNPGLWMLSSSIVYADAINMYIRVNFDSEWSTVISEETLVLPTQYSKAHRIIPVDDVVFATELSTSKLAILSLPKGLPKGLPKCHW